MKKAVIDIGTNSTRLYIADIDNGIRRIEKHTIITRLGKGVDKNKRLSHDSMMKNMDALLQYKKIAESYAINQIRGIATSAVRDAENREEFLRIIKEKTDIDIDVISGEEEAMLGFIGASSVLNGRPAAVIDIGGGSTEFIYGAGREIALLNSIDIGAVRMTERFMSTDLISSKSIEEAGLYIRGQIRETISDITAHGKPELIGIGGTVTTLAAVDQELEIYDIDRVHGYKLYRESVESILKKFISMNCKERKLIKGLQSERADIIPAGTLILKIAMEEMDVPYVIVSECDNLDGFMIQTYGL